MKNSTVVVVILLLFHTLVISACTINEYECDGGGCIPNSQLCDNTPDCPAVDDENTTNCNSGACPNKCTEGQIHCADCSCASTLSACTSQVTTNSTIGDSSPKEETTTLLIVGIVLGCICLIVIAGIVVLVVYKCKQKKNKSTNQVAHGDDVPTSNAENYKSNDNKLKPLQDSKQSETRQNLNTHTVLPPISKGS